MYDEETNSEIAVAGLLVLTIGMASYYSLEWVLEKAFVAGMCGNNVLAEAQSPDGT